jgi:hypothetical protein
MILISILTLSTSAQAVEVEVKITFNNHFIQYHSNPNTQHYFSFPGRISCEISSQLNDDQNIVVNLRGTDTYGWGVGVGPSSFIFTTSGIRDINVSVSIPPNVLNRTINKIWAQGNWEIEPYEGVSSRYQGDVVADYFEVQIYREYVKINSSWDTPTNSGGMIDQLTGPCFIFIIIFIISIIAIIVFYYKIE